MTKTLTMQVRYRTLPSGVWQLHHPTRGWIDERSIPAAQRPWRRLEPTLPYAPNTNTPTELPEHETFWGNGHYLVHRREFHGEDGEVVGLHLSMRTVENDTRHDWREMQQVKNELAGELWEAVELYPSVKRLVDMANQFHLWCFPHELPIGFPAGAVASTEEAAATGATQRAFA